MNIIKIAILLVATLGCQKSYALPLPFNNLTMPVLIRFDSFFASGFYFGKDRDLYLVTAKHALFNENPTILKTTGTITLSSVSPSEGNPAIIISFQAENLLKKGNIKYHPNADIVMVKLFKGSNPITNDVQFLPPKNVIGQVREYALKVSSEIYVSGDVFVFGYPAAIGIPKIPQIDYNKPLVRKGNIAGVNKKNGNIIIACPVYGANSGGPVVEEEYLGIEKSGFRIIGIISEYIPHLDEVYDTDKSSSTWENYTITKSSSMVLENSGYAVVVPIDRIHDLLKMFNLK